MESLKLTYYKNAIISMVQKITNGEANIAKPILLLTLIDLIEEGHILGNKILFDERLKEHYNIVFLRYSNKVTKLEYPFYYMRNDGFYYIKGKTDKKTPSAKYLKECCEYAYLDDALWDLLQSKSVRDELRLIIQRTYSLQ